MNLLYSMFARRRDIIKNVVVRILYESERERERETKKKKSYVVHKG